jgi:hypothetical protein
MARLAVGVPMVVIQMSCAEALSTPAMFGKGDPAAEPKTSLLVHLADPHVTRASEVLGSMMCAA